jgi:histidine triad (HIT) family protein
VLSKLKNKRMSSIFTKIINEKFIKIAENDKFWLFLDVNQNAKGHTLCIPKVEINKIFDIEDDLYLELMLFAKCS